MNVMRKIAALLLILLALQIGDGRAGLVLLTGHNGRHTQLNIPTADYNSYLDVLKGCGRWSNVTALGAFDVSTLDVNGWPTSLPAAGGGVQCSFNIPASTVYSSYYVLCAGGGTVGIDSTTVSCGSTISLGSPGGPVSVHLRITAVGTPGVDYLHDIHVIANNGRDLALYQRGETIRPEYNAINSAAGILRAMDATTGAANGGGQTVVNWQDRKPLTYYAYGQYYFPPAKIVPIANVTYDGISTFTVTWSGQTGMLVDKTQFIAQVPNTVSGTTFTILNSAAAFVNTNLSGSARTSITAGRWMLFTFDSDLQTWMVDDSGGSSNTGIENGIPPESLITQANEARAHLWLTPGMYMVDCSCGTGGISDYYPNLATLAKTTLNVGLLGDYEVGPNETFNAGVPAGQTEYANNKQTFRNGGTSAYPASAATAGATTIVTIGTNTTQVGSLLAANLPGLSPASSTVRVVSKPNSTQVVINVATTGTYTSGGTLTPINSNNFNNWYGIVASNVAQAIATVYGGVQNKGVTYLTIGAQQAVGGIQTGTNTGTSARYESPFLTAGGGSAAYPYLTHTSGANYFQPSYGPSRTQMTVIEGQLAFEYITASVARKAAILDQYSNSTNDSQTPVNISGITPGNPTVLTVDSTVRFVASDSNGELTTLVGVTGTMAAALNRGAYVPGNNSYTTSFTVLSKTATTVTINANTTGLTYTGGGQMSTKGSLAVTIGNEYLTYIAAFQTYMTAYSLGFVAYEGGQGPDTMGNDSSNNIKGLTNGTTTIVNVGANSWDYLYNTVGLTGMTTQISAIAAGTLATLLNGNTYTILSATPTTITINVDTSAVSSWVSGGTTSYVGSMNAVNTLRVNVNYTPAAQSNTVANYNAMLALGAGYKFPSEFTLIGQNYGMNDPDIFTSQYGSNYRQLGMQQFPFLLKRDMQKPGSANDNDPMWLEKAA